MKKIIILLAIAVVFGTFGIAADVHAAAATAGTFYETSIQMGSTTTMVYNLSKNVWMQYGKYPSTGSATAYATCTSHNAGDRTIGTGNVDQKIYYKDGNVTTSSPSITECNAPADAVTSKFADQASWSAL